MRPDRDTWFLDMATLVARRATCLRRAVGCVLVNARGQVLSTGYNGVAAGLPHCNETVNLAPALGGVELFHPHACPGAAAPSGTDLDRCQAIHAEQNALLQCPDVWAIATCYVTCSPCVTCAKLLLNTGCRRVVAARAYSQDDAARHLWAQVAGREWLVTPGTGLAGP